VDFLEIKDKADLSLYLGVSDQELDHLLYRLPSSHRYHTFTVKKKDSTFRVINSPTNTLKVLQSKIKEDLAEIFGVKGCVHGFVKQKNILTNAILHLRKNTVVNIDLKDFFSSIHFGRVRGMFMKAPFNFNNTVSTLLAQICCFNGFLPQGAPTSPIISNFICRGLDNSFLRFSKEHKLYYSRYADDITLSSNKKLLTNNLGKLVGNKFQVSDAIISQISGQGFSINESKARVAFKFNSQSVTGVKVNLKPNVERLYIKRIRAILHASEKFGVEKAAKVHFIKNSIDMTRLKNPIEFFLKRIVGMVSFVGMIRGKDDHIYAALFTRVKAIVPNARLSIIYKKVVSADKTVIFTEGKTDWKHMKSALLRFQALGRFTTLDLEFADHLEEHKVSNSELFKICDALAKSALHKRKIICIFDRDDKNFVPKVTSSANFYKDWTNNVYSMVLPVPLHRNFDNICIEHYYRDEDLHTYDRNNRRIFTSDEFDLAGQHKYTGYTYVGNLNKLKSRFPEIIDSQVVDSSHTSVALSKSDFANNVLYNLEGFGHLDVEPFNELFTHIETVENLSVLL
jgi:RNA-directed DNA polymerase